MNPNLKIVICVQAGMLVGGLVVWAGTFAYSNSSAVENPQKIQKQLSQLIRYANIPMPPENFSCEFSGVIGLKPTVGNVVASIISSNLTTMRNRQSFGCFENTCSLSISNCQPWQSNECSERFLRYEIDKQGVINPKTFACFDVP